MELVQVATCPAGGPRVIREIQGLVLLRARVEVAAEGAVFLAPDVLVLKAAAAAVLVEMGLVMAPVLAAYPLLMAARAARQIARVVLVAAAARKITAAPAAVAIRAAAEAA